MVLRTSREVLETMLSRIHVLIAYLDVEFRFVRVNEAYARAGGQPCDYYLGKRHFDLYPSEENEAIFRRVMETGESYTTFARPFRYPDQPERGTTYWDWMLQRIVDEQQKPVGLLFSLIDVTERQRALLRLQDSMAEIERLNTSLEATVEQRTAQLRDAMRELEAFTYSVSHDLRSPVHAISGFADLLAHDHGEILEERGRRLVNRIRTGALKMEEMIESLLDLSNASVSKMMVEPVDLSAIARGIVAELSEREPDRAVRVSIADNLEAVADPRLMRILLTNLLSNAWKYTAKTADAEIEVGSSICGETRELFVRDNGSGFDQRQAARLFVPFQRLHGSDQYPGTGVGLATVQRIVRRHGGLIRAEGVVGAGATFTFTLGEVVPESGSGPGDGENQTKQAGPDHEQPAVCG